MLCLTFEFGIWGPVYVSVHLNRQSSSIAVPVEIPDCSSASELTEPLSLIDSFRPMSYKKSGLKMWTPSVLRSPCTGPGKEFRTRTHDLFHGKPLQTLHEPSTRPLAEALRILRQTLVDGSPCMVPATTLKNSFQGWFQRSLRWLPCCSRLPLHRTCPKRQPPQTCRLQTYVGSRRRCSGCEVVV